MLPFLPVKHRYLVVAVALCPGILSAQVAAHADRPKHSKKKAPPPAPVYVSTALEPLRLDQTPVVAPQVSYVNEQLMIVAPNSTLIDVLRAIHLKTGAVLDMPPDA